MRSIESQTHGMVKTLHGKDIYTFRIQDDVSSISWYPPICTSSTKLYGIEHINIPLYLLVSSFWSIKTLLLCDWLWDFKNYFQLKSFSCRICHPFSEADPSFPTRLWASIEALSSNVSLRNEKSTFYRIRWQKKARFATTMYKKHTRPKTNTTVLRTNNLQKFWACWNFT